RMLEEKSLWFRYKTQVWLADSPQRDVVHNVIRILRSVQNFHRLAYVSAPITSGSYLYELRLRSDLSERERIEEAMAHNYYIAYEFMKGLRTQLACPIIFPPDLTPAYQEWEQTHFQALWFEIIAEFCTEMHMCDGWHLSNGGVEEFVHAV